MQNKHNPHHLHITSHHSTPHHLFTRPAGQYLQVSVVDVIIVVGVIPPSGGLKQMLSLCRLTFDRIIVIKSGKVKPIQLKEIKES